MFGQRERRLKFLFISKQYSLHSAAAVFVLPVQKQIPIQSLFSFHSTRPESPNSSFISNPSMAPWAISLRLFFFFSFFSLSLKKSGFISHLSLVHSFHRG